MNKHFLREQSGAVIIEAAFLFVFVVILIQLMVEFSFRKQQQTALERVNFVLAKVVRERNALYDASPLLVFKQSDLLTQDDVDRLADFAQVFLKNSSFDFTLRVEATVFTNVASGAVAESTSTFSAGNTCTIPNLTPLSDYGNLSAWTNNKRWMPIYRVSLCQPRMSSPIEKMINRTLGLSEVLTASNIVLSR